MIHQAWRVPQDAQPASEAAAAGQRHELALADRIIFATAARQGAVQWIQDAAFKDLPGAHFVNK
jgi:predicted nucleic acid-binding protein